MEDFSYASVNIESGTCIPLTWDKRIMSIAIIVALECGLTVDSLGSKTVENWISDQFAYIDIVSEKTGHTGSEINVFEGSGCSSIIR
ncbi:MAG: hypothetical protein WC647_14820 [Desulfomonilaceae bacterium]|jgi:hypothetical protein